MGGDVRRARIRELGVTPPGTPGPWNAITDVAGVEVGMTTLLEERAPRAVRTGVTAILPRGRDGVGTPAAAGVHALNGNGEMTGSVWIRESGSLSTPVLITNTHSVGACHEGAVRWTIERRPELARGWLLPVVAETWDGYLNDINGLHVRPAHAIAAIDAAASGPVAEGAVGGGTGMVCYGFKGGSGTSSRRVRIGRGEYTVGVFVQANFGARRELSVAGRPFGPALLDDDPAADPGWLAVPGAGSVIAIVATDAPLLPTQCEALARRVSLGLARTGTSGSHFSGDVFLAFSTANEGALASVLDEDPDRLDALRFVPWGAVDPLYEGVVHATEEAVLNALAAGTEFAGDLGHRVPGMVEAAQAAGLL